MELQSVDVARPGPGGRFTEFAGEGAKFRRASIRAARPAACAGKELGLHSKPDAIGRRGREGVTRMNELGEDLSAVPVTRLDQHPVAGDDSL